MHIYIYNIFFFYYHKTETETEDRNRNKMAGDAAASEWGGRPSLIPRLSEGLDVSKIHFVRNY